MKQSTLVVLIVVTAGLAGAAYFAASAGKPSASPRASGQSSGAGERGPGEPLFAGLQERAGDVATVRVRQGSAQLTLQRGADGAWGLADRGGFPVQQVRIQEIVRRVLEARVVEPKTALADLHEQLGLGDPLREGAKGRLVELLSADGTTLAALVVGNRSDTPDFNPDKASSFVRAQGQDQTYLVRPAFGSIAMEAVDYVDRRVLSLAPDRFALLQVVHPPAAEGQAGESLTIEREARGSGTVTLRELPAGRALASPRSAADALESLSDLTLDDVRPEADLAWQNASESIFQTYDGVTYRVRSVPRTAGDLTQGAWVAISVAFDGAAHDAALPQPAPAPEQAGAEERTKSDEARAAWQTRRAEVERDVGALAARLHGWAFAVPQFKAGQIAPRVPMLLATEGTTQDADPAQLPPGMTLDPMPPMAPPR